MRDVVHIRLLNGDELIAYLVSDDENEIRLHSPLVVEEREDPKTGGSTIVLSKYILFNESDEISIKKNHVITSTKVLSAIEKFYKNSLVYNEKFVNSVIISEIEKANRSMEANLQKYENEVPNEVSTDTGELLSEELLRALPVSNTIH